MIEKIPYLLLFLRINAYLCIRLTEDESYAPTIAHRVVPVAVAS